MGRAPRETLPDGLVHAFIRGNRYERIFLTQRDAGTFLDRAAEAFTRFGVDCWSYCLMPTHYHFLLHTRRTDLSRAMHRLNGGYARWFNREHGYRGHVFGDRFSAFLVFDEPHFLELVRYVVLNPVKAGLCTHPREWRWSSYGATVGTRSKPPFLRLDWMRELMTPAGFAAHVESRL